MRMKQQQDEVTVVQTSRQNERVTINNNAEQHNIIGTQQQQEQYIAGIEIFRADVSYQNPFANGSENRLLPTYSSETAAAEHQLEMMDKDRIGRAWTITLLMDRKDQLQFEKIQAYPASV